MGPWCLYEVQGYRNVPTLAQYLRHWPTIEPFLQQRLGVSYNRVWCICPMTARAMWAIMKESEVVLEWGGSQQTQNILITFIQCWSNVFDVGPTLYKCYTNVLCLLEYAVSIGHTRITETLRWTWTLSDLSSTPYGRHVNHPLSVRWQISPLFVGSFTPGGKCG